MFYFLVSTGFGSYFIGYILNVSRLMDEPTAQKLVLLLTAKNFKLNKGSFATISPPTVKTEPKLW